MTRSIMQIVDFEKRDNTALFKTAKKMIMEQGIRTDLQRFKVSNLYQVTNILDKVFFVNWWNETIEKKSAFCELSNRMTSSAGSLKSIISILGNTYVLKISNIIIIRNNYTFPQVANGLKYYDKLEMLMSTVLHELVHFYDVESRKKSAHDKKFKQMVFFLTGQSDIYHEFGQQNGDRKLNFQKGDKVSFVYKNQTHIGRISRITKRATVMTNTSKWYIPLSNLTKVND